jgi:Taurine catabolism dioxygenase TauD, TfdA family
VREAAAELSSRGFVRIDGPFRTSDAAFDLASALVETCRLERGLLPLPVIGDFVIPPPDGAETRDFQTLHFDFGLPLDPKVEQDVARYTALHVPADVAGVQAATRLVPLGALLSQRSWPPHAELVERLASYGRTHGAWEDDRGYVEGSLARIVEAAAAERSPILPSVKVEPGFLCGLEFDSLSSELAFFARHGLRIRDAEIEMPLEPGELLLFDNLAVAHGRRGTRQPGELHQRVFGHHHLQPAAQRKLRDQVLTAFYATAGKAVCHPFDAISSDAMGPCFEPADPGFRGSSQGTPDPRS